MGPKLGPQACEELTNGLLKILLAPSFGVAGFSAWILAEMKS
jgi:hypothetical protein